MADFHSVIRALVLMVLLVGGSGAVQAELVRVPAQWIFKDSGGLCAPSSTAEGVATCIVERKLLTVAPALVCSSAAIFNANPRYGNATSANYSGRYTSGGTCTNMTAGSFFKGVTCAIGKVKGGADAELLGYPSGYYCEYERVEQVPCDSGLIDNGNGQCVCPTTNALPVDGKCPDCKAGDERQVYTPKGEDFRSGSACMKDLCEVKALGFCSATGGAWQGCTTRVTGAICVPAPPETTVPTETPPPDVTPEEVSLQKRCMSEGKTYGTVNGVGVCLARGAPGGNETDSQGSKTETQTGSDGKVTETVTDVRVQTMQDGTLMVTTTTTRTIDQGGAGEAVETETNVQRGTRSEICTATPGLAACRSDGGGSGGGAVDDGTGDGTGDGSGGGGDRAFGGSCSSGFTCEGDAIQCAIAKEQHKRNCEMYAKTDQSDLFLAAIGGNDPGLEALKKENREVVAVDSLISTERFIGGGCIEDLNVPFGTMGALTIPFSRLCPYLEMMGNIVVAFSMLAAARIIYV